MPRKTKAKKPAPAPRFRWEHDCPGAKDDFDQDFLTPEDALEHCREEILRYGDPGEYNCWVGEHVVTPANPNDANVDEDIDEIVAFALHGITCDEDNLQIRGTHAEAAAGLKLLLGQWFANYVEDHWPLLDRSTAEHYVIEVPAKTEPYPTVAVALDQCLKSKLPPDVRRLLRQARQKLLETT